VKTEEEARERTKSEVVTALKPLVWIGFKMNHEISHTEVANIPNVFITLTYNFGTVPLTFHPIALHRLPVHIT
jgi:hypothetical protein